MTASTSGASAPDLAYDWVRSFIARLPREDDAFLTESTIAQETGVSRTPVREALLRLEAQGFVRRIPHKGAYIPAVSDDEVHHVLEARGVIERWSAGAVADLREVADTMAALLERQRQVSDDPAEFVRLDTEFHTTLVRGGGNPLMNEFYKSLRERQLRMGLRALASPSRTTQVLGEHMRIVDALRSGDAAGIAGAIGDHLATTRDVLVRRA